MYKLPVSIEKLVTALSMFPGIGTKTAQRFSFYLLKSKKNESIELANAIVEAIENIDYCKICGNFTDTEVCSICSSDKRDRSIVCVVENPQDIIALEASGEFNGLYHVLMGSLSPLDGIGPEELRIRELEDRVYKKEIKEIILATDPNVEGEATAAYIKELLNNTEIKVTMLAQGIPIGGNLEYSDGVTLGKAITGRREI